MLTQILWVFDTERYWKAYNGGFFCLWVKQGYTKGTLCLVGYNPLTPTISSSNRGGGVAPDCMDFALKASFPWLQAPFLPLIGKNQALPADNI